MEFSSRSPNPSSANQSPRKRLQFAFGGRFISAQGSDRDAGLTRRQADMYTGGGFLAVALIMLLLVLLL
jgi:hypothetical protein